MPTCRQCVKVATAEKLPNVTVALVEKDAKGIGVYIASVNSFRDRSGNELFLRTGIGNFDSSCYSGLSSRDWRLF